MAKSPDSISEYQKSRKPVFSVRHVLENDIPHLHQISSSAFGEISPYGRFNMRQKYHAANDGLFLVAANNNNQPVAYVFATPVLSSGKVFVWQVAVHQDFRNLGIAQFIMTALEKEALRLGFANIELHCDPDNVIAKKLYRRCGYYAVGILKNYASDSRKIMRLIYEKNIVSKI